ncbi:MAG: DUF177 domain-containing protein [Selenomonadales bacterium]|nr:DUF177 domain-containing protein [Selenomonadales bacterium]
MRINTGETKMQVGVDQQFHFITSARQLDIDEKTIKISNDIVVDGTISYTGRLFQVSGSISFLAERVCDRCLESFTKQMVLPFDEVYQEDTAEKKEEDAIIFEGTVIDLSMVVREMVVLADFSKALCDENCKGLCLKCGTNLNEQDCQCDRYIIDPRLAALQSFFDKNED